MDLILHIQLPHGCCLICGLASGSNNGIIAFGYGVQHRKVRAKGNIDLLDEERIHALCRSTEVDNFRIDAVLGENALIQRDPEGRIGIDVGNFDLQSLWLAAVRPRGSRCVPFGAAARENQNQRYG
ncbi:hypothetical protein D3C73_1048080 [compost metagenome]